ncbi:DUF3572 family protein [Thioclava sp. BHET1]|nr:DUF3572 family protein [Thioclava sp. BHET1]
MGQEAAETLALQALGWLVGNDELLPVFLGATGAELSMLRARAQDADFLLSVLDFLLMDDLWVVAFCEASGQAYQAPQEARQRLAGPSAMHWT